MNWFGEKSGNKGGGFGWFSEHRQPRGGQGAPESAMARVGAAEITRRVNVLNGMADHPASSEESGNLSFSPSGKEVFANYGENVRGGKPLGILLEKIDLYDAGTSLEELSRKVKEAKEDGNKSYVISRGSDAYPAFYLAIVEPVAKKIR